MRTILWEPSGSRHATTCPTIAKIAVLALMVGALLGGSLVLRPEAAHAQTTTAGNHSTTTMPTRAQNGALTRRLEVFSAGVDGAMWHRWSDDNGASWSAWVSLGRPAGDTNLIFVSSPAAVSSTPGHLDMFAMSDTNQNSLPTLQHNTYNNGQWSGWSTSLPGSSVTGVYTSSGFYGFTSGPAVSSWGPGHMDLFVNGYNTSTGAIALLHTWADGGTWSGHWEVLGSGFTESSPAAVSWGPGRVDVFEGDGVDDNRREALEHKWYANGHWSAGWENLGGTVNQLGSWSTGSVTSEAFGSLAVFVGNANSGLSMRKFANGQWAPWVNLEDGTIIYYSPQAAASRGFLHVFSIESHGKDVEYKHYSNGSWSAWQVLGHPSPADPSAYAYYIATVVWNPFPLTIQPLPPAPVGRAEPGALA